MLSWRQTTAGLHRSVHTASTAWALSWALRLIGWCVRFFRSVFSLVVADLAEVIGKFLFLVLLITDTEFEFALFGPEDDGLAVHPSYHVKGRLRFAAQGQLQEVFLDAGLDGLAQLELDLEEAVGGTKSVNALVGSLVIVIFNPQLDPLARGIEAVELGAHQELLPEGGPEAFHLAQRHGMLRSRFEVRNPVLLQFRRKPTGAPPTGILPAIVGQHLLGRLELTGRHAVHLDHRLRRGAAEQVSPHDEPGVIIHKGDDISVTSAQTKGEDVRLPHLIGRGPFEEPGTRDIPLFRR